MSQSQNQALQPAQHPAHQPAHQAAQQPAQQLAPDLQLDAAVVGADPGGAEQPHGGAAPGGGPQGHMQGVQAGGVLGAELHVPYNRFRRASNAKKPRLSNRKHCRSGTGRELPRRE